MATERRILIYFDELVTSLVRTYKMTMNTHIYSPNDIISSMQGITPVDAVPVDEIKLHHVVIDNEGVPEVKLQIGDRYFILRTDPVDAREVVNGRWKNICLTGGFAEEWGYVCSECGCTVSERSGLDVNHYKSNQLLNFCPNCGADMRDGDVNG